jgi:KAP P-loop domain protein
MAIDGEWGSGKTTFVKKWEQSLRNEGFHTLYFNVWEDDFIDDPVVGLVGQLRKISKDEEA